MEEQSSMKNLDLNNVTVYFSEKKKKCLLYLFLQSWFHHVVSWAQDRIAQVEHRYVFYSVHWFVFLFFFNKTSWKIISKIPLHQ